MRVLQLRTIVMVDQRLLHQIAQDMPQHDVRFLNELRNGRRNAESVLRRLSQFASIGPVRAMVHIWWARA